jgi:hypothetical protein
MKKNYQEPECVLVLLRTADLITLSYEDDNGGDNWDW